LSSDSQSSSSATLSEVEGSSSSEVTADTTSSSSSVQNSLDTLISSSSSEVYLDWSIPKEAYLNPNITYGEMTDARDGQIYKTVKIGNRTWMAQNLNYADSAITPSIVGQSWCFDDDPEKCKVAGRLYTWNVAVEVCPDGWHLPTKAELDTLISLRERVLKSQVGWADKNGVDAVGFSIIPAGIRTSSDSIFGGDGSYAFFWTASEKTTVWLTV
jgi:Fibrobacter succinogenes major domain (Fib_succ_major).